MGPQHPSTHGVFQIILDIEGERVIRSEAQLGFAHRGTEKMAENRSYLQTLPMLDRFDYLSPVAFQWGLAGALERGMGIEPPSRAEYIRVIMAELNRQGSHYLWVGALLLDLGAFTPFLWAFDLREKILDMMEEVTGQRMTSNYVHVGGVRDDITDEFLRMLEDYVKAVPPRMKDVRDLIEGLVFLGRVKDIGIITKQDVIDYGLTGPVARGSGIPFDVRRHEPYSVYPKLDFNVPVGTVGDSYDRYAVRMDEIIESNRILEQCLGSIPDGPYRAKTPKLLKPAAGEYYQAVETARGLLGVYVVSDGSDKPYRMKLRSPSFSNVSIIDKLTPGCMMSDVVAVLGSIDIVVPEIDR